MPARHTLEVQGRRLQVSNLDKVLYPAAGFTKGQVIDFYIRIAPALLPHLRDRPVTLKRYPNGIGGKHFYEKDKPRFTPEWVSTFPVPRRAGGTDICYVMINDLPTLVWCANLANLEIHPFLHRAPQLEQPTAIVFDLDPGDGADILDCAKVAFLLKDLFAKSGLELFAKVSGSRGLQVYAPLNTKVSYETTRPLAKSIAEFMQREHPQFVIAEMAKVSRHGKVFIDWSQNSDFKTTVSVYSLRAKRDLPYVSMPVTWDELHGAMTRKDRAALDFPTGAALKRLETAGDLFAPMLKLKQRPPADLMKRLQSRPEGR